MTGPADGLGACSGAAEGSTRDGLGALARRCVALAVAGRATPERVARAVRPLLERPEPVTAAAVVSALEQRLGRPAEAETERAVARLGELGAHVHVVGRPGYPPALAAAWPELGAPLWLFVRSPDGLLPTAPAVAIVGTRRPTVDGLATARALAGLLARHGVTVVSGLARGIDQAAHRGALEAGGRTIGVLGTGFGVDYPRGDGALRADVAASGGVVTELPPGVPPRPPHFLWRNRIVSGLAQATVVVEGGLRSGALQTARLAAGQGRDVWAVPGSINAPTSRGPLALVRDGARLLTCLDDVLDSVPSVAAPRPTAASASPAVRGTAGRVLERLSGVPATVGELAATAGLDIADVMAALAELDERGLAQWTSRGIVRAG